MKKQEIQDEWERLIYESTQNKPNITGIYPRNIVRNRELLLLGQVELGKIEYGKNIRSHTEIYQSVMKRYFQQKKCLKI
ncbi:hypothetical protein HYX00_01255 [Candidatus Woesearchaeota archaeon]|nr:hypothetical protein [Candidatus Woesearchaeota archaeon]